MKNILLRSGNITGRLIQVLFLQIGIIDNKLYEICLSDKYVINRNLKIFKI